MTPSIDVLFSEDQIKDRVIELGHTLTKDYLPDQPLVLIGVLRGALHFLSDLSRTLPQPVEIDFISVSSYVGTQSSGKVTLSQDISTEITGKHALIVEDIVDTGRTLHALLNHFRPHNPLSLKTCALLDKPSKREVSVSVDYTGFSIPDQFVVGYGLDYNQAYRHLPYIGIFQPTSESA